MRKIKTQEAVRERVRDRERDRDMINYRSAPVIWYTLHTMWYTIWATARCDVNFFQFFCSFVGASFVWCTAQHRAHNIFLIMCACVCAFPSRILSFPLDEFTVHRLLFWYDEELLLLYIICKIVWKWLLFHLLRTTCCRTLSLLPWDFRKINDICNYYVASIVDRLNASDKDADREREGERKWTADCVLCFVLRFSLLYVFFSFLFVWGCKCVGRKYIRGT